MSALANACGIVEWWNDGMLILGHAPSWPDATERVPPERIFFQHPTIPAFAHSRIRTFTHSRIPPVLHSRIHAFPHSRIHGGLS
jgi:hypothetical protein